MTLIYEGPRDAPIVVVTDPPSATNYRDGMTISIAAMRLFGSLAGALGFNPDLFTFVAPCPPMSDRVRGSDAREAAHLKEHREEFLETMALFEPRCIVTLGKHAIRQVANKATKITKVQGQVQSYDEWDAPVLPMMSPAQVLRFPEHHETFETGFHMLALLDDHDYDTEADPFQEVETNYRWVTDLQFLIDMVEAGEVQIAAVDAEATGLDWYRPEVYPICAQICWSEGEAVAIPLDHHYWNMHREAYEEATGEPQPELTRRDIVRLTRQFRRLMEDPRLQKVGHNFKIDHHFFRQVGVRSKKWTIDTMLFAFLVDENMVEKSLDECVRRWVPAMRGYADTFNATTDKSRMIDVPLDKMLTYGCGDSDATLRLAKVLYPLVKADPGQWNCYRRVMLPAMSAFMNVVEPEGMTVDVEQLGNLQEALDIRAEGEFEDLLRQVPRAVRRRHVDKGLKFTRPDFVRDILFSPEGFNLTPRVFTKSTMNLPDAEKVPSTSAKDHLPYFDDVPFVASFMDYQRLAKMRSTYVGHPAIDGEEATGFWKYIFEGKIHPSFLLHRTVTGRSASANPNAQNFPKRGKGSMKEVVKAFRRIFRAPPGYKLVEADLSQAELRIAAWMAGDRTMIDLYRNGADIHAMTAAATMGLTLEQFYALDPETVGMKRFQAKAVNFGFLYGMWWLKFMAYAKTDYGLDYSEREAQHLRSTFFNTYSYLDGWHDDTRQFAHEHGYVRALHGAVRHLPNIYSPDDGVRKESERQAINSPVQRFASDLGLMALGRLTRDAPLEVIRPVGFIHDSVVAIVREDLAEEAAAAIQFYMETPPLYEWFGLTPPIPIISDVALGDNLGDMEELEHSRPWQPDWYQPWEDEREDAFLYVRN
jgi:uracil-DNA glycosylase family 4